MSSGNPAGQVGKTFCLVWWECRSQVGVYTAARLVFIPQPHVTSVDAATLHDALHLTVQSTLCLAAPSPAPTSSRLGTPPTMPTTQQFTARCKLRPRSTTSSFTARCTLRSQALHVQPRASVCSSAPGVIVRLLAPRQRLVRSRCCVETDKSPFVVARTIHVARAGGPERRSPFQPMAVVTQIVTV